MSAHNLKNEVRKLRAQIVALMDEAAANERLLKRSQERELELLRAETIAQLFDAICNGLKASYALEAVTLVLRDPDHEIRHLLMAEQIDLTKFPHVLFADRLDEMAPQFHSLHKPWLGPYIGGDHQRLFPRTEIIRSVALIPLRRQDELQGSLNFGSADEKRFSRHLATDFLAHLGVIAAFAIENTINRARLVRSGLTDYLTGWHNRRVLERAFERRSWRVRSARARDLRVSSSIWTSSRTSTIDTGISQATWHCAKSRGGSMRRSAAAMPPHVSAAMNSSCSCRT